MTSVIELKKLSSEDFKSRAQRLRNAMRRTANKISGRKNIIADLKYRSSLKPDENKTLSESVYKLRELENELDGQNIEMKVLEKALQEWFL